MTPVHCRGCRRQIGVHPHGEPSGVYCTEMCADDIPAGLNEDRDALIEILVRTGTDRATVTKTFGLTKQRLSQVLAKRMAVAA